MVHWLLSVPTRNTSLDSCTRLGFWLCCNVGSFPLSTPARGNRVLFMSSVYSASTAAARDLPVIPMIDMYDINAIRPPHPCVHRITYMSPWVAASTTYKGSKAIYSTYDRFYIAHLT
jgi:hypothetical protein